MILDELSVIYERRILANLFGNLGENQGIGQTVLVLGALCRCREPTAYSGIELVRHG